MKNREAPLNSTPYARQATLIACSPTLASELAGNTMNSQSMNMSMMTGMSNDSAGKNMIPINSNVSLSDVVKNLENTSLSLPELIFADVSVAGLAPVPQLRGKQYGRFIRESVRHPRFEGGELGEQLRQVTTLIQAGLDTPVFRVRLTGFDTHQNQRSRLDYS